MAVSEEMLSVLESEIVKKTLSLDALKALSDIKEKLALLESDYKSLSDRYGAKDDALIEKSSDYRAVLGEVSTIKGVCENLRIENESLRLIRLEKEFNVKRGDEMKEIVMAVLRNPIKSKQILETEEQTTITETQE